MRKFAWFLAALSLSLMSACVTINVYFPAAAAEKAAEQFIGKVIGDEAAKSGDVKPEPPAPPQRPQASVLDFFIGAAHAAEPDLNIQTPAVREIQARMKQRFDATLVRAFGAGTIGLTRDGLVAVRDASAVPLAERAGLNQAVADENRDRKAVYREIAVGNGHPEWEGQIQGTFAKQWIEQARAGWYHQDPSGAWKQK
ncbi:YdbL family protein [Tahibacter soli]|uniref:YdbL family protein n=1 Tax=Tahibacter soli TaxID=2983605 RepID=A0A9X3YJW5_9GAMM|nr:YdbL family protein [Tahibacter soli]MDC8012143.1 YdbL family protein [Tahibacter soli]